MSERCAECGTYQHGLIENDLCVKCHDKTYAAALAGTDENSRTIAEEYRMTARRVLGIPGPTEAPNDPH